MNKTTIALVAAFAAFVSTASSSAPSPAEARAAAENVPRQAAVPVDAARNQAAAARDQLKGKLKSPLKLPKLDVPNLAQAAPDAPRSRQSPHLWSG